MALAISPNFSKDRTLIVNVKGKGLFRSSDGGIIFAKMAPGSRIDRQEIRWIEFSNNYEKDKVVLIASGESVFISDTNGNNWKMLNNRPVRYENHRDVFQYQGKWKIVKDDDYSASTISVSDDNSAKASLKFVGRSIALIGPKAQNLGIAKIFIDGKFVANLDQYSRSPTTMTQLYAIKELSFAPHTITIEVSGARNPASQGHSVSVDALDVWP
jgi:hypothetical protein